MPPTASAPLLSPAELSYLHTSLSLTPPIRPDARQSTQFRPLIAECGILPGTNGSARICFADGTEAIAGVKAEVEQTEETDHQSAARAESGRKEDEHEKEGEKERETRRRSSPSWIEVAIEIPGFRDDDALPVFLNAMLREALLATGLADRLWISERWHWKCYLDILLLSPPSSYPVPLLSLTAHLALRATRLPALVSEADEDPHFNDDWDASTFLYARAQSPSAPRASIPPVTLLVISVGANIFFDPTREELAVADAVLAVSLGVGTVDGSGGGGANKLQILAIRTIDSPARLVGSGLADAGDPATMVDLGEGSGKEEMANAEGVWKPPTGGMRRDLLSRVLDACLGTNGVGEEVLAGLEAVDVG